MESDTISTSVSTIRTLHQNFAGEPEPSSSSAQASPKSSHSSCPDSPDSVSSFPSVSSSFFFSSAAASPPHSDYDKDSTQGLIIPSLALPSPLKQPTQYGKTLGQLRLIFLCPRGAAENLTVQLLLDDNPDIVDVGSWEEQEYGRLMRASTDWVEHADPHGLEDRFEPIRNIQVIETAYDQTDVHQVIQDIQSSIHSSFQPLSDILVPRPRRDLAVHLLASPASPLFTALILALPPSPTAVEDDIIDSLAAHIPLIILHRPSSRQHHRFLDRGSTFKPSTLMALRTGLFRSPETLNSLRTQTAEKFLDWRRHLTKRRGLHWTKQETEQQSESEQALEQNQDLELSLDPLHFRSLLLFSMSILGPSIGRAFINAIHNAISSYSLAIASGFCIGIGTGYVCIR